MTTARKLNMLNIKVVSAALATAVSISYLVCVAWGLATPESLHMHTFLEAALPGFKWLSWQSFLLGWVESFLFGAYAGLLYAPIYNFFNRRWDMGL